MSATKKYGEVQKFISDNLKPISEKDGEAKYQVNQEHWRQFMTDRGITKETLRQVSDANEEYYNGAISAASALLKGSPKLDRVTINTRTAGGVVSARVTRRVETRTPVTGEPITKYGVVSLKVQLRSKMDKDLLAECAAEIEKSSKK